MIPPKYVYEGDEDAARKLRGFAQSQLEILRNSMLFQNLKQGRRVVRFDDGTVIELTRNHGLETAVVYVPTAPGAEEEEERIYEAVLICTGGLNKQGGAIADPALFETENKQGSLTTIDVCKGAVKDFGDMEIFGPEQPDVMGSGQTQPRLYEVSWGVPPYRWSVSGSDYYFLVEDDEGNEEESDETWGRIHPAYCVGGFYHGYRGGTEGITGMIYVLFHGVVITKDICERGGGGFKNLGDAELYFHKSCGGILHVEDICGNEATFTLKMANAPWIEGTYTVRISGKFRIHVQDGSSPFEEPEVTGEGFTYGGYKIGVYTVEASAAADGQNKTGTFSVEDACGRTASVNLLVIGCCNVPEYVGVTATPELDYETETVAQGGNTDIDIEGGCGPYTVTVSGSGFWLDDGYSKTSIEVSGGPVTLYADDESCGTATVTVTDVCGDSDEALVRGAEGYWDEPPDGKKYKRYKYASPCADPEAYCNDQSDWYIPNPKVEYLDCFGNVVDTGTSCSGSSCAGALCRCEEGAGGFNYVTYCQNVYDYCNGYDGLYWGETLDIAPEYTCEWVC